MSEEKKQGLRKQKQVKPKVIWANLTNTHYLSVRQCIEEMGYRITESEWKPMIMWYDAGGSIDVASTLTPWQFYNHFPGIWSIARKVELARNIDRMARVLPDLFTFHPKSFLIPGQSTDMKLFMMSIPKKKDRTFIIKPDRGSQGRGIILIQDPDDMEGYYEMAVAQQYIKPFLIDGYKFDLRVYVLLTSVDPLRMYIFREGMARFCTEKYVKPRQGNLDQVFSHLTNYSLNKKNERFEQPEDAEKADCGSKRSMSSVMDEIRKQGHDVDLLMREIDDIIRRTIGGVQPFLANNYHTAIAMNDGKSRCFEILGFDILIDKKCHPWLLEVNCMPSLACDSPFDKALKMSVINGTLKILNLNPNFKKQVLARQKAVTQKRISGVTNLPIRELFNPQVESDIAKTTKWRQIWPLNEGEYGWDTMEETLKDAKANPIGTVETTDSRARKEATLAKIKEQKEGPRPLKKALKRKVARPEVDSSSGQRPAQRKVMPKPKLSGGTTPRTREVAQDERVTTVFKKAPKNEINETEERDRLRSLRNQMQLSNSSGLFQTIQKMIEDIRAGVKRPRPAQAPPPPEPKRTQGGAAKRKLQKCCSVPDHIDDKFSGMKITLLAC